MNGKIGVIDQKGNWVIQPEYTNIQNFIHKDYTFFKKGSKKKYGIINDKGEILCLDKFSFKETKISIDNENAENSYYFKNEALTIGLILCKEGNKYGFKNLKGEWAIQPIYDEAKTFNNGYTLVGQMKNNSLRYGIINSKNETIIPIEFWTLLTAWSDSYNDKNKITFAGSKDGKTNFTIFNEKGESIWGPFNEFAGKKIMSISPFKNGYAKIDFYLQDKSEPKCYHPMNPLSVTSFINKKGELAFEPKHIMAEYVNKNGLIPFLNYNPSVLGSFLEPEARAKYEEKLKIFEDNCGYGFGYMNLKGEEIIFEKGQVQQGSFSVGMLSTAITDYLSYVYERITVDYTLDKGKTWTNQISHYGKKLPKKIMQRGSTFGEFEFWSDIMPYRDNDDKGGAMEMGFVNIKTGKIIYSNKNAKTIMFFNEGIGVINNAGYTIERKEM